MSPWVHYKAQFNVFSLLKALKAKQTVIDAKLVIVEAKLAALEAKPYLRLVVNIAVEIARA